MLRSEGFLKYLKNTSWLFVERMVRLAIVLVTGIFVARYLGDSLFGQLNYATGFIGLFFSLSSMGIDAIIARDLVKHPEKRDELLGSSAAIKMLGSFVLFVLVTTATFVRDMDGLTSTLILVIALGELIRPFGVIEFHFMAHVNAKKAVKVQLVQAVSSALIKVALVFAGAPLILFAWVYVFEAIVLSLGYVFLYQREGLDLRKWTVSKSTIKYVVGESWPMLVYGIALHFQARIDQVMIGDMLADDLGSAEAYGEVGQYSVALKMIEALGFLPVVVQMSLTPAVTRAKVENESLYLDRLLNQYRLMFALFLVTSIPLYFVAEPVIVLLYGEEFRPAGFLLSLFAIRLFFTNMGMGKSSFITNESLFKYSLLTALVGAGLNIVMNYFLIPEYKAIGAIWATIGSFTVSIFLMDLISSRTRTNLRLMLKAMFSFWRLHRVV